MKLDELKDKQILILGFGKEGKDNFLFLRRLFPKKNIGIADKLEKIKKPDNKVKLHLGKNYLKALKNYDVIIKSPGVPIHLPEIEKAFKEGKITFQTEIFFDNWPPERSEGWKMKANSEGGKLHRPGKIIGITGTKGKSTTAALIYKILKEGGLRAHLVGNIGKPVLQLLFSASPKDVYIYELSSHQLYNLKKSPPVAVFLNIYPEHLDYYRNFQEYLRVKQNITRYQKKGDYFIYNSKNPLVKKTAKISKAKKISFNSIKFGKIIKRSEIPLIGDFNLENVKAAIAVGEIFKISNEDIARAIRNFKPLPHRLEYVGIYRGIKFYNDALSTIPETTIAGLNVLGNKVQTVMLGGFDRKIDFKKLAQKILRSKIKTIILFPTTGEKIWKSIRQAQNKALRQKHLVVSRIEPFFVSNMPDAVRLAFENTKPGKICLLSCASTSFSIFRDYKEKGNLFKKYVRKYAKIGQ